ncbi:MAG: acyltransferase [Winogradskyella sp.]|nr:acyltransferase [Winogradskyella sp.]
MKYIKQFDGLRALAVIAVIVHHWSPEGIYMEEFLHLGAYGVDLFFVLSGFLITTILIKQNEKKESFWSSYKTFVIRRSLRIFPVYFIFIILFFLLLPEQTLATKLAAYLYQFNWYLWFTNKDAIIYLRHIWSLSAEEQFYIVWPILILCLRLKNGLKYTTIVAFSSIFIVTVTYIVTSRMSMEFGEIKFLPFHSFIALSLGGILAFLKHGNISIHYHGRILLVLIVLFTVFHQSNFLFPNFVGKSLFRTVVPLVPLMCFLIIDMSYNGFTGIIKKILENKQLVFLGKISYGLYLYHMVIPFFVKKFNFATPLLNLLVGILLLILVTITSYYLVEKPINNLKRKFSY